MAIAVAVVAVTAFVGVMYAFAVTVTATVPPDLLAYGGLLLPSNIDDVFAVLVGARFAKWIYRWNMRAIDWKLKASI